MWLISSLALCCCSSLLNSVILAGPLLLCTWPHSDCFLPYLTTHKEVSMGNQTPVEQGTPPSKGGAWRKAFPDWVEQWSLTAFSHTAAHTRFCFVCEPRQIDAKEESQLGNIVQVTGLGLYTSIAETCVLQFYGKIPPDSLNTRKCYCERQVNGFLLLSQGDYSRTCFQPLNRLTSLAASWESRSQGGDLAVPLKTKAVDVFMWK